MCFQIFLERRERWRAADVCRKRTLNTPIKRKSSSSKGMKRIAHNNQNSSRRRNTKTNYYLLWKHIHDNGIICCLLLTLFAVFSTQCNSNSYDGLATLRLQEQNEQKVYLTNRLEFLIILNNHCTFTCHCSITILAILKTLIYWFDLWSCLLCFGCELADVPPPLIMFQACLYCGFNSLAPSSEGCRLCKSMVAVDSFVVGETTCSANFG